MIQPLQFCDFVPEQLRICTVPLRMQRTSQLQPLCPDPDNKFYVGFRRWWQEGEPRYLVEGEMVGKPMSVHSVAWGTHGGKINTLPSNPISQGGSHATLLPKEHLATQPTAWLTKEQERIWDTGQDRSPKAGESTVPNARVRHMD